MKTRIFVALSSLVIVSCATSPPAPNAELVKYSKEIALKIEPLWKTEVKNRVRALGEHGLKPISLPSPDNEVIVVLSITKDGEIADLQTAKKSRWAFLNKAAFASLKKASPVEAPPASCVKENVCKMSWKFVVEQ